MSVEEILSKIRKTSQRTKKQLEYDLPKEIHEILKEKKNIRTVLGRFVQFCELFDRFRINLLSSAIRKMQFKCS